LRPQFTLSGPGALELSQIDGVKTLPKPNGYSTLFSLPQFLQTNTASLVFTEVLLVEVTIP
jgi:hypothetical protein